MAKVMADTYQFSHIKNCWMANLDIQRMFFMQNFQTKSNRHKFSHKYISSHFFHFVLPPIFMIDKVT